MMDWLRVLTRPELIQRAILIDGVWLSGEREQFAVSNPATGEQLALLAKASHADLIAAVASSHRAFLEWKLLPAKRRSEILRRSCLLLVENSEDLALILSLEQGKPLAEAKSEILYAASYFEWYSEEAKRLNGTLIPANNPEQRLLVQSEPLGVCAAITPWNFPSAMLARKIAPALAAGCTIVAKPASSTPLSAAALAFLLLEAGVPAGVVNLVHGHSGIIGEFLCHHPQVRKLSFTGSTEVGIWLYQNSANSMKKLSLELGGNAPLIVFADADLSVALQGILDSKFRNGGQTCICSNRIFVHESIKAKLLELLSQAILQLKVGNGLHSGVNIGPLIDENALIHAEGLLADALQHGGRLICGGKRLPELGSLFWAPTLIECQGSQIRLFKEEIFAPILAVYGFSSDEEVIRLANDTPYGLASYIFSRDVGRVFKVAESLEYGMVGVNTGLISAENVPFGGVKMSGLGREGGQAGIEEYLSKKYICINL